MIIGGLLGYFLPIFIFDVTTPDYDRSYFDKEMENMFGDVQVKDTLTNDVMLVAFSYNIQEPRFYSRYAADKDPLTYDISLSLAV